MAGDVRVPAKGQAEVGGLKVQNETANSILVRREKNGLVVVNCCLEEQGM